MDVKCDYCDSFYDDQLEKCPNCGATNKNMRRVSGQIPKTIAELQQYCIDNKVPVQQMHFHIGENYTGPKAFGIYRDGENVIVYKNKSDGSRAIRYNGRDEAYAVNEIYQKMRSEFASHKAANSHPNTYRNTPGRSQNRKNNNLKKLIKTIILANIAVFIGICIITALVNTPASGYYTYNGDSYYNQRGSWYVYDSTLDDWAPSSMPYEEMDDYYDSSYYSSDYGGYDFSDSGYYEEPSSYSSDSSSSWDDDDDWDSWDSGSDWDWDSGSSWDSDW